MGQKEEKLQRENTNAVINTYILDIVYIIQIYIIQQ